MRAAIEDRENDVYISACAWEIAIKAGVGKLPLPEEPSAYVRSRMRLFGFIGLPIDVEHALAVASLPKHHDDPFDRLLIAQAQLEGLTIVTADPQIAQYSVHVL